VTGESKAPQVSHENDHPAKTAATHSAALLQQKASTSQSEPALQPKEVSGVVQAASSVAAEAAQTLPEVNDEHASFSLRLIMLFVGAPLTMLAAGLFVYFRQRLVDNTTAGVGMDKMLAAVQAVLLGGFYIGLSALMIESNKWLMAPDRFPYPCALTINHMIMSTFLANSLRFVKPQLFPAYENIRITPRFLLQFVAIGVPFAASLVCSNWAYKYLSVSFLQIMKQSNIVTIYCFSVIAGLEALRRCNVILLAMILAGAILAVKGELHFVMTGFILQVISSLCEATKVIIQSVLMTGQGKLDSLTMVLFMAPACLVAGIAPLFIIEGDKLAEMQVNFLKIWPVLLGNAMLAFTLNCTVAQCIKQLSAVGYLLCGIVKDICIIATSTWFLDESLSNMQKFGFSMALTGVGLYSLYKQNSACFVDDDLTAGFGRLFTRSNAKSDPLALAAPTEISSLRDAAAPINKA